ncbi:glycoside hydrolase family 95 protein [Faecalicatena contorta]
MMCKEECLWYLRPAKRWTEALPLGNGRIGAMVYGGSKEFKVQIDESTFWSGEKSDSNNKSGMKEKFLQIRTALLKKDYQEADRIGQGFVGNQNQYGSSLPIANLSIICSDGCNEDKINDYRRFLSLEKGIYEEVFSFQGNTYERTIFLSNPAQTAVIRMRCLEGKKSDYQIRYDGIENNTMICDILEKAEVHNETAADCLIEGDAFETLHSDGKTGVHLQGILSIHCDGKVSYDAGCVLVTDVSDMVLYMDLATTMYEDKPLEKCNNNIQSARQKGYDALLREHVADHGKLYHRMEIALGDAKKRETPTDVRIKRVAAGESDQDLFALMFQYGRYLLIASSRENSPLPTHMGGIWNDNFYTKMDCGQDMHIDMNIQMQYWASGMCNLSECYMPVLRYIEDILVPSGQKTAMETYGADGWTAHVVSNPWGFTSLGWGYNWGVWAMGGVWCTTLLWDYYEYTKDLKYLKEHAYPIIEGAAKFVEDYVFYDSECGCYMSGPSYSPENMYRVNGKDYYLALSNTCDIILIREILNILIQASDVLGKGNEKLLERANDILDKLPPFKIGAKGQLQEWYYDYEEAIPNHRHTSHLLGLYPFYQIDGDKDFRLSEGIRKTIGMRYENLEITSWCMNMLQGYYARLGDGEAAVRVLKDSFKHLVRANMSSVMSPWNDETSIWGGNWELDGNTGLTASMAEQFIQSNKNEVKILPALPAEWKDGYVKGICIKGGHSVDIFWKEGSLDKFIVYPHKDDIIKISYAKSEKQIHLKSGKKTVLAGKELV